MARLGFDLAWQPQPIMWVPHYFIVAMRIVYNKPELDIGGQLSVWYEDIEFVYIIKEHDEETLEWKLVWPD